MDYTLHYKVVTTANRLLTIKRLAGHEDLDRFYQGALDTESYLQDMHNMLDRLIQILNEMGPYMERKEELLRIIHYVST